MQQVLRKYKGDGTEPCQAGAYSLSDEGDSGPGLRGSGSSKEKKQLLACSPEGRIFAEVLEKLAMPTGCRGILVGFGSSANKRREI